MYVFTQFKLPEKAYQKANKISNMQMSVFGPVLAFIHFSFFVASSITTSLYPTTQHEISTAYISVHLFEQSFYAFRFNAHVQENSI